MLDEISNKCDVFSITEFFEAQINEYSESVVGASAVRGANSRL